MDVFASPAFDDHEQVVFFFDRGSGLKAIVALHDTTLGPAIGGCRMWPYASEADARDRRPAARQGHDLQGGHGRPAVRRRQDRDHRRSQDRQVGGAVPGARPRDRQPRRALLHRRGRRHLPGRHGLGVRRDALRAGPLERQQRRSVAGHGARRLARDSRRGQAPARARRPDRHPGRGPGSRPRRLQRRAAARPGRRQADRRRPRSDPRRARRRGVRRPPGRRRCRSSGSRRRCWRPARSAA